LAQFIKNNKVKGAVIETGLWKYTRHPNYFGEAFLWWGVYLIACNVEYGYYTFPSALVITLLLRFVSGVPLLEERQMKKKAF
jgi:steroid 5-alpha reductase family enzyme